MCKWEAFFFNQNVRMRNISFFFTKMSELETFMFFFYKNVLMRNIAHFFFTKMCKWETFIFFLIKIWCITSEISSHFNRKMLYFFDGVYVSRTNLNWRFKPIREYFTFFPIYTDIYLPFLTSIELFFNVIYFSRIENAEFS